MKKFNTPEEETKFLIEETKRLAIYNARLKFILDVMSALKHAEEDSKGMSQYDFGFRAGLYLAMEILKTESPKPETEGA